MKNKKRYSVYRIVAVIFAMLSLSWLLLVSSKLTVNAEEDVEPYGLLTKIDLDMSGKTEKFMP